MSQRADGSAADDHTPQDEAAEVAGYWALIAELRARNAISTARVAELERQPGLNSGNSGKRFRSETGAAEFGVIRSVLSTARKQGWNMLQTLTINPSNLIGARQPGQLPKKNRFLLPIQRGVATVVLARPRRSRDSMFGLWTLARKASGGTPMIESNGVRGPSAPAGPGRSPGRPSFPPP